MKSYLLVFCDTRFRLFDKERINKNFYNNTYENNFDKVIIYNENNLDRCIYKFCENVRNNYGPTGYGMWIWKPYIILKTLESLDDGDILVFMNSHCILENVIDNIQDMIYSRLNDYNCILSACTGKIERHYTSKFLQEIVENYLNYKFSKTEIYDYQCEAGSLFIYKCSRSIQFVKMWLYICLTYTDFISNIFDKYDNKLIATRHDQSVFSLLYKYYKLPLYWKFDWLLFNKKIKNINKSITDNIFDNSVVQHIEYGED